MKKLNHSGIIKYISGWYDQDKKEIVIITELLPGGSLKHHLNKIKSPRLRLVKFWIREILKGLKYLHTEIHPPIIHRDIKCDNIFIDNTTGGIKIGDLGICDVQHNSYATSYAGTEEFMAPEVYEGRYTVLADIYSLGMSIIEMVTLEKPYRECESAIMQIYENVNIFKYL
jgi:WNK lysine deficient protein kinase